MTRGTHTRIIILAVTLVSILVASACATTVRVPTDQPTIQTAVNVATPGDTVVVAAGVHYEHDILVTTDICLRGETGSSADVVIDAQQQGRVLRLQGLTASSEVAGFTITGGAATELGGSGICCESASPVLRNLQFLSNSGDGEGGGLFCDNSSPTLIDVAFVQNSVTGSYTGGGMYCRWSSPVLTRVTFSDNTATRNGGGLYCINSSPVLQDVSFEDNEAGIHGGGMYCATAPAVLERVTFTRNHAGGHGGGLFCIHSAASISESSFVWNSSGNRGAGLRCYDSSPDILDTIFLANESATSGGAISCEALSSPLITSVTIASNGAAEDGSGLFCEDSSPHLNGVIVAFGESGGGVFGRGTASPSLACCDVFGNAGGDFGGTAVDQTGVSGNISVDPLFCDMESGDLTIGDSSACAPDNNGCGVLIGAHAVGCSSVAVEETSIGVIKDMYRTR